MRELILAPRVHNVHIYDVTTKSTRLSQIVKPICAQSYSAPAYTYLVHSYTCGINNSDGRCISEENVSSFVDHVL